jgi:hypothetical protein
MAEPHSAYVELPREELDVLRRTLEAVACGPIDGVWDGLRAPIEYLRAALGLAAPSALRAPRSAEKLGLVDDGTDSPCPPPWATPTNINKETP